MLYKAVATLSKRKAKVMNLNNAVPILKSKGRIEHNGIQGGPNIRSKSENMHQRKQGSPNIESKKLKGALFRFYADLNAVDSLPVSCSLLITSLYPSFPEIKLKYKLTAQSVNIN